jgi:hypothetical protein
MRSGRFSGIGIIEFPFEPERFLFRKFVRIVRFAADIDIKNIGLNQTRLRLKFDPFREGAFAG